MINSLGLVSTFGKAMQARQPIDTMGKIIAEYVWIDGSGVTMRSKCRTLPKKVNDVSELPSWNFDGSSCYQATTTNSEIHMKPVAMFRDPFRLGDNLIVMCDTY